jgi:high-affinity iron transporter
MSTVTIGQAAFILFREGAEALLVIAALAAYLSRIQAAEKTRVLYWGAGLAVVASLGLAYVLETFLGGGHNDLVEGATMVLASAVLIYVSGWLFARRDAAAWQAYLRSRVDDAIDATASVAPLGLVAFLAVFREGAETVLFLQALAGGATGSPAAVAVGVAIGALGLGVLFIAVKSLAIRLPLKPFFTVTAVLLYLLAVTFVGQGMMEFQEMNWLPFTSVAVPEWLEDLGVGISWEAIGTQIALLALAPLAIGVSALRARVSEATAS